MSIEESMGKAVKDFLAEAEEILDQLSLDLVALSDCADGGECSPDLVNSVFRAAHSLKGLALGANEYLVKPFDPQRLQELICRYLD